MPDSKTIAFYDSAADRYANLTARDTPDASLTNFMALLPKGAKVLDLGCGPARASADMRDAGFLPDPVDASSGMIKLANTTHNIGARLLTFDEVDMVDAYAGIWANFSLLHAPLADLPRILRALASAVHRNGILHIAMKTGAGEARDAIDRMYSYVSADELSQLLTNAGFDIIATQHGSEIGCAGTNDPFIIMRARKND